MKIERLNYSMDWSLSFPNEIWYSTISSYQPTPHLRQPDTAIAICHDRHNPFHVDLRNVRIRIGTQRTNRNSLLAQPPFTREPAIVVNGTIYGCPINYFRLPLSLLLYIPDDIIGHFSPTPLFQGSKENAGKMSLHYLTLVCCPPGLAQEPVITGGWGNPLRPSPGWPTPRLEPLVRNDPGIWH